jgi:hypothetical protein
MIFGAERPCHLAAERDAGTGGRHGGARGGAVPLLLFFLI